nr:MAG TPA: hypothetical protein [Caudoviricetes sp.]
MIIRKRARNSFQQVFNTFSTGFPQVFHKVINNPIKSSQIGVFLTVFVSILPDFKKFSTKFSTGNPHFRGQKVAKNTNASRACVLIDFFWFFSRRVGGIFSLSGGRELFQKKLFCLQMIHKKDLAGS